MATSFDRVVRSYEKPDRYAAAICIKVRLDCSLRGYSATKAVADPCYEGRNGPQTLSELEVSSNDYFFFFLAVFLAVFFAFFAFLAMLPSIIPKVVSMQADHRHACIQSTPILKLIPRASKRVNDGHAVLRPDDVLA